MIPSDFETFQAQALADGFDVALVREWAPDARLESHDHPFDSDVWVARGEFWLTMDGQTRHLRQGDHFVVPRGVAHAEQYGAAGATFWAARRN